MKGLEMNMQYTALQQSLINRLAEIEQEDADRCRNCGGEDCICCEYYIDRQRWSSPEELFYDEESWDYMERNYARFTDDEDEEEDE